MVARMLHVYIRLHLRVQRRGAWMYKCRLSLQVNIISILWGLRIKPSESRERVRAAFTALGMGLPGKRITVNLAPADLPKEGAHYDLPIALGLLAAVGGLALFLLMRLKVLRRLANCLWMAVYPA